MTVNDEFSDLISVYVTTKNRPELLARALLSIAGQTYNKIEVLVCNDGSDEEYDAEYSRVINEYKTAYKNFIYIKNDLSRGACYSRNILINKSSGRFITGLDDDDYFFNDRIETFLRSYKQDYAFICTGTTSIIGETLEKNIVKDNDGLFVSFDKMKNLNLVGNQIFVEREKIIAAGCFDESMPAWQDYDMWFRILMKYPVGYKLNIKNMFVDIDENRKRISTSSNAFLGYQSFIRKHKQHLNKDNLVHLYYGDLLNRKQKFTLLSLALIKRPKLLNYCLKQQSRYNYPNLYLLFKKMTF